MAIKLTPLRHVRGFDVARPVSIGVMLAIMLPRPGALPAEPIPVRYREGTIHGFLAVRTLEGKILATGDLTQAVRKNVLVSRLVFRFRDGSVDDETATFSQEHAFRLISDHHVQKAPRSLIQRMFLSMPLLGR